MNIAAALLAIVLAQADPASGTPESDPASPTVIAPAAAEAAVQTHEPPSPHQLRKGAEIEVELAEQLSSKTSKPGQMFAIRLAAPIMDGERIVAPAGASGQGEIIDARSAGMSGREGKLTISARSLEINGRSVRLRGMTMIGSGTSRVDLATGVSLLPYVGPVAMLVRGGEIIFPAGARATARIAEDTELPAGADDTEGGL